MEEESIRVNLDPVLLWAKFQPQELMLLKYNLLCRFNIVPEIIIIATLPYPLKGSAMSFG